MLDRVLDVAQFTVCIGHWEKSTVGWELLYMITVCGFVENDLSGA